MLKDDVADADLIRIDVYHTMWATRVKIIMYTNMLVCANNSEAKDEEKCDLCAYKQGQHLLDVLPELQAVVPVHLLHVREHGRLIVRQDQDQNEHPVHPKVDWFDE